MNVLRKGMCFHYQKIVKLQYLSPKQFISHLGKWEQPQGYDTGITVYNSAVNQEVPLVLKKKNLATWYMCGPTVYAESHIGHASCYVKFDIIRRILENVFNIKIFLLLGITDIDDKIIKKSNEAGISSCQLAKRFEIDFFEDMEAMKVLPPTAICRVSENIDVIISFCEKLIEKRFAYVTNEGNVYFMVSKGVTADILNEIPEEFLRELQGQRDPLKNDPRDFALWKAVKPNEPFWSAPWGNGRPGWHIECSAMASKIFGSNIDLHSGGSDLLFPHHSNEVSQSQAYHHCSQWVNYWLHAGLLQVDEELKMSKSLGNTISIKDFLRDHYVNDFRILCLQSHYRKNLYYDSETLSGANSLHKKIHNFINDCESYISGEIRGPLTGGEALLLKLTSTREQVISFLGQDFSTRQALLCLTNFIDEVNKSLPITGSPGSENIDYISIISSCHSYVNGILEMLGIHILTKKRLSKELLFAIDSTVEFRNKIRFLALNPQKVIGNGESASCYIDKMYKNMEMKLDAIQKPKVHQTFISNLLEDSKALYKTTSEIAETQSINKILSSLNEMKSKEAKKSISLLFNVCDKFRSVLYDKGIEIKDRSNNSSWIPTVELKKNAFN